MTSPRGVVSVIGGAGHVGLPLALVVADSGHFVYGVDLNEKASSQIMQGRMPFCEEGGSALLTKALEARRLCMTTDLSKVAESDVVVIVLGTPIDENLNPDLAHLRDLLRRMLMYFQAGQLVILRSTVSPGTTDLFREMLERETDFRVGENFFVVFAPERVAQGKAIEEIVHLPQIIGAYDDTSYENAKAFFSSFIRNRCLRLTPIEAEVGKLMTNMYRYVQFSLANEFYLIAESFGANIHRIINACTWEYPRFNLANPGPNVGGPCLYKDGFFLLERFPFSELITVSFKINESMPMQITQKIKAHPKVHKVAILGLAFKAGSDDTRNSLSFKLKKQLAANGYTLALVDPHVKDAEPLSSICGSDCVVLMTPHPEFANLAQILDLVQNPDCLYVDIWGFWPEMRGRSANGCFYGREVSR